MTFNSKIVGCYWNEEVGEWTVKIQRSDPGCAPEEFEEKCDLLLHATGILNNFKFPDIEGLENFKGRVVRSSKNPLGHYDILTHARYCQVAQRLSRGAMERRFGCHHRVWRIIYSDTSEHATSRETYRYICPHGDLVYCYCWQQW
jgi:hypothetical protein